MGDAHAFEKCQNVVNIITEPLPTVAIPVDESPIIPVALPSSQTHHPERKLLPPPAPGKEGVFNVGVFEKCCVCGASCCMSWWCPCCYLGIIVCISHRVSHSSLIQYVIFQSEKLRLANHQMPFSYNVVIGGWVALTLIASILSIAQISPFASSFVAFLSAFFLFYVAYEVRIDTYFRDEWRYSSLSTSSPKG